MNKERSMGMNNAQKQAVHRARLRSRGLVHVQAWVTVEQAQMIRLILSGAATATASLMPKEGKSRRRKKLTAADEAALRLYDRNRAFIEQYRKQIEKMEQDQLARSEIRAFLEERGADFGGKTTVLNTFLGSRKPRLAIR